MPFVQLLVFAGFNLLLLPYAAHKTGYRWWAYLIWGVILGAVLALPSAFMDGMSGGNMGRTMWIIVDASVVLFTCLRLALTKKRYQIES